ncbi:S8 family serine peptidase [Flavivirga rizhaonensis]|uniref:T9SS type A sorting domain-containing protein n=1 Tax=Flavivirga rizhaonensis TaxID=2559571 RepID=A0A4S1DYV7_9FLAO|nr:S8 family serine peptidase [Flavivirga rizhaonensis]TGV03390.1 T9SS type A sorting domain-containing protein [Flavivirga rizhaonensis]
MKTHPLKALFVLFFIIITCNVFGQKTLSKKPSVQSSKISNSKSTNSKFSGTTALFLNEKNTASKTSQITKNGVDYINTAILLNEGCSIDDISNLPILTNTGNKNLITALIPVNSFELVSDNDCIKYLDIGVPFKTLLDEARYYTNTDEVHQGLGLNSRYDGSGVIVGIIDGGFDFTHPTFKDSNGDLRISKVWIQGDDSGTNPNGYNYGTEYAGETQILTKQTDTNTGSHGTHVTGIAAGIGTGGSGDEFKGIAYNSEIVLVSYTIPFEQSISNRSTNLIDALNYLVNYSKSVNKPLVINMSLGSHYGSHDGTSLLDQEIDSLVDDGIIIVGSAGNEGSKKLHMTSSFNTEETKYYFIENNQNLAAIVDIWGATNTNFDVSFSIYNTINDEWIDVHSNFYNTNNSSNNQLELNDAIDNDKWTIDYIIPTLEPNLRPRAIVIINYSNDLSLNDGDIFVLEIKAQNTNVHAWVTTDGSTFENYGYSTVEDGDTNITIGEIGGTANNIITVGAYTTKNNYTDFQGNNHNIPFLGLVGDIASFSSKGPTVDGRIKPDITAPGNVVVSSVNSFDNDFTSTSAEVVARMTDGFKDWWFATSQGTSMSAPVVTGIIALWLEARPDLDVNDIKAIFDNTAIQDSFTGTINNNTWGRGKIDAWLSMFLIEQSLTISDKKPTKELKVYPNPTNGFITIKTTHDYSSFELFNVLGKKIKELIVTPVNKGYSINLTNIEPDIYFLSFTGTKKQNTFKVVKTNFTD